MPSYAPYRKNYQYRPRAALQLRPQPQWKQTTYASGRPKTVSNLSGLSRWLPKARISYRYHHKHHRFQASAGWGKAAPSPPSPSKPARATSAKLIQRKKLQILCAVLGMEVPMDPSSSDIKQPFNLPQSLPPPPPALSSLQTSDRAPLKPTDLASAAALIRCMSKCSFE